jgi:hypothetical protein
VYGVVSKNGLHGVECQKSGSTLPTKRKKAPGGTHFSRGKASLIDDREEGLSKEAARRRLVISSYDEGRRCPETLFFNCWRQHKCAQKWCAMRSLPANGWGSRLPSR